MESFIERVRFLTQQLPEFGIKIPEAVTIELVRKRLPERFNVFAQTLLAQLRRNKSGYTLKELLNKVLDEDRKTKADTTIKVNFTRKATTGQSLGKVVKKPQKKTKGYYCKYCKKTSYDTEDCWFLFGKDGKSGLKANKQTDLATKVQLIQANKAKE